MSRDDATTFTDEKAGIMRGIGPALVVTAALLLNGCMSSSPQRYVTVPDNTPVLRALGGTRVAVGPFTMSAEFDPTCRMGSTVEPPVNMTFPQYIQNALADELKVAGVYDDKNPNVRLRGNIDLLDFSSTTGVTNGEWLIGVQLTSSNGQGMYIKEHYEFESGFEGSSACRKSAEAFLPAVQNLIGKLIRSVEFRTLLGS